MNPEQKKLSNLYSTFEENFSDKRYKSTNLVRSKVHSLMLQSAVSLASNEGKIIDLGCGDGTASFLLANKGLEVVGVDISKNNIKAANLRLTANMSSTLNFYIGDACKSEQPAKFYDYAFSHHVLEHLLDLTAGITELKRITKKKIIIAVPSPWSPLAWTLLGNGNYWSFSYGSLPKMVYGLVRTLKSWFCGRIGVDEGAYSSLENVPHVFYFPGRFKKKLECSEWRVTKMQTQVLGLPWILKTIRSTTKRNKKVGLGIIYILDIK
jgi:2-polyprenyl-3-methyl-5-hydroxy-6-metoxy-1,4-benzoquinol methylase